MALCLVVVIIGVAVAIWAQYDAEQVPDIERPESRNVSILNFKALCNPIQVLFESYCSVPQWLHATCWNGHREACATMVCS